LVSLSFARRIWFCMTQSPVPGPTFPAGPQSRYRRFTQDNLIKLFWSSDQIWSIDQI
jgi:hypothetical protein